jgi:AraC-like DNA-binding protein
LQLVLPLAGTLEMTVGGEHGRVAGLRFAVVAPGTDHVFHATSANRFLIADFPDEKAAADRATVGVDDAPFRLLNRRAAALLPVLRLESASGALAEPPVADALSRYVRAVFALDRQPPAAPRDGAAASGARTRFVANQVRAFLDERWGEPVTLGDAAEAACCSPAHATRCFRSIYGVGPIGYLQRARIDRARLLLETTDLTAGEIAGRVGFVSQPWFTRLFAREVGMPPGAYRAAFLDESSNGQSETGKN